MRRLKGLLAKRIFWLLNFATFSMRRLIINADDFGRSRSINEAVVRAHREGVLTSASLMMNEGACDEAVALARENPRLGVGLHPSIVTASLRAVVNALNRTVLLREQQQASVHAFQQT